MNAPQNKTKSLFLNAVELHTPAQRRAYLDGACGGDEALRREVEELLRHFGQVGSFLQSVPTDPALTLDEPPIQERPGTVIGPYKLMEQIGEGGMGLVFVAEQQHPVRRKVALKVIKPGMDTRQIVARFEAERQALALMDHPHIAKVHDGGTTDSGRPYFVMELVKGVPITDYCDQNQVSIRERLELFVPVCQAVQHAHQKGIIHRDLKPGNVLVVSHDGTPVVKVIDFGVAKAISQQLTDKTIYTQLSQMIGTPLYMSPEQAGQSGLDVDTRSDIYSLGVLLYELLTGTTPFDKERLKSLGYDEIRRIIREEEPPKPSTRISTLGQAATTVFTQRQSEPKQLGRLIRGELDWIVMTALEKDRNRRYETANGLARDVQRYLANEPVRACPPSVGYRLRKFLSRNRGAVALTAAVVLMLMAGIAELALSNARIRVEKGHTLDALNDAKTAETLAEEKSREAGENLREAQRNEQEIRRQLGRLHVAYGARLRDDGDPLGALPWFARALKLDHDDTARAAKHRFRFAAALEECPRLVHLWFQYMPAAWRAPGLVSADGRLVFCLGRNPAPIRDVATGKIVARLTTPQSINHAFFSFDGTRVATASSQHGACVWHTTTGKPLSPLFDSGVPLRYVVLSPDGSRAATIRGDESVCVWDAVAGKRLAGPLRHESQVTGCVFSPNGQRLVTGSEDGTAQIWEVATGKQTATLKHQGKVHWPVFSPDGRRMATVSDDTTARLWDPETGALTATLRHTRAVYLVSFSPDNRCLATASQDGTARVWDAATGKPLTPPLKHGNSVSDVEFSPDGRLVATASLDSTARVWDAGSGKPVTPPLRHQGRLGGVHFGPFGRLLLTHSFDDGTVRVWEVCAREAALPALRHNGMVVQVAFSGDGRRLATASSDRTARVWDAASGQPLTPPLQHAGPVLWASFNLDGRRVVTASSDKTARVWDADTGEPVTAPLEHGDSVNQAVFSPDGRWAATASKDGTARIWDAATGKLQVTLECQAPVMTVAFSPDSRQLVTACWQVQGKVPGVARVWDAVSGKPVTPPLKHGSGGIWTASFSPDGRLVLTACEDHTASLWDAATGKRLATMVHGSNVPHAAFSPDGRRVVSVSVDRTARVWDAATGKPLVPPMRHRDTDPDPGTKTGAVRYGWFSPDGKRVMTVTLDGRVRLWDAQTSEPLTPPLRHWGTVRYAVFSPDGRRVATACGNEARIWDLPAEDRPVEDVVRLAEVLAGGEVEDAKETIGFVPLDLDRLRANWELLRARYPRDFQVYVLDAERAKFYRDRGDTFLRQHQWEGAIAAYSQAIPFDQKLMMNGTPDNVEARKQLLRDYENLGLALRSRGRHQEAVKALSQAAALAEKLAHDLPDDPCNVGWLLHNAHRQLAWSFISARRCGEGEKFYSEAIKLRPDDAMLWFRRAEFYARLGLWDLAARDSAAAFKLQPPATPLQCFAHAVLSIFAGDLKAYRQLCVQMPRRFPPSTAYTSDSFLPRAGTMTAAAEAGVVAWAVEHAERCAKREPAHAWNYCALGRAYFRAGKYERAVKQLRRFLELDSNWCWGGQNYAVLAMAYHHLGQDKKATEALEKAGRAIDRGSDVLARGPAGTLPMPWWEDWLECSLLYREAKTLIDDAPPADDPRWHLARADAFAALGDEKKATDSYATAVDLYEKQIQPGRAEPAARFPMGKAYCRVGILQWELKQYDKAADSLAKAISLLDKLADESPTEPQYRSELFDAHLWLGRLWETNEVGRLADAEQCYRRAIALADQLVMEFPKNAEAYRRGVADGRILLGWVLRKTNRFQDAEAEYLEALKLWQQLVADFPKNSWYRHELAYTLDSLGWLWDEDAHRPEKAEPFFRQALEHHERLVAEDPTNAENSERLAKNCRSWLAMLTAIGAEALRHDQAQTVKLLKKAVDLMPEESAPWHALGTLHYRTGEYAEAIQSLNHSLALQGANVEDFLFLAMAHWQRGEKEQARRWYSAALLRADLGLRRYRWTDVPQALFGEAAALMDMGRSSTPAAAQTKQGELESYTRILEAQPEAAWAYQLRGQLHRRLGHLQQANADACRAFQLLTRNLSTGTAVPEEWGQAAVRFSRSNSWDMMLLAHSKGIELNPENEAVWYHERGLESTVLEQYPQAVADYSKAIALKSKNGSHEARDYARRAYAYLLSGEHDKAQHDIARALELKLSYATVDGWTWDMAMSVCLELGQWKMMAAHFSRWKAANTSNSYLWYLEALADVAADDIAKYRKGCAAMLDKFGRTQDPVSAHWTVWSCVLAPDAVADWDRLVKLAEFALQKCPANERHANASALGALLHRAGRSAEAIERLEESNAMWEKASVKPSKSSAAYPWFFLAMAHHRLGHVKEARHCFDKARERADRERTDQAAWNRKLTLELLQREAAATLGAAEKK